MDGPLRTIWRCAPDEIGKQDVDSGLFPFMLAATTIQDGDDMEKKHTDTAAATRCVDNVYGLLRCHPQVLSEAVTTIAVNRPALNNTDTDMTVPCDTSAWFPKNAL